MLLFGAFRRAASWGSHGGYGPGSWSKYGRWDHRDVPPPVDSMLESWHRRAHGEEPPSPTERETGTA